MSSAHRSPEWLKFSKAQRKLWQVRIDNGGVPCRRCRGVIRKGTKWHLGHVIDVRLGGPLTDPQNVWPEHVPCNTRGGARLSHEIRYGNKTRDEREPNW